MGREKGVGKRDVCYVQQGKTIFLAPLLHINVKACIPKYSVQVQDSGSILWHLSW